MNSDLLILLSFRDPGLSEMCLWPWMKYRENKRFIDKTEEGRT